MKKNEIVFQRKVEKSHIADLPLAGYTGPIYLVDKLHQIRNIMPLISNISTFGFDTETKPSFHKGKINKVSLLQLATHDKAFLFRINHIGIPDIILKILEDEKITKIGVALHDDLKSLARISPFNPAGFIDLQKYVGQFNIEDKGLKKITANVLGFRISKRFQTSNWEETVLSMPQLEYAATDAWVCYEIYDKLVRIENFGE